MNIYICICREIYIYIFPLLLFFNQKNESFTITYNDTDSYNLDLVKCVFGQDFQGVSPQTSVCVSASDLRGWLIN